MFLLWEMINFMKKFQTLTTFRAKQKKCVLFCPNCKFESETFNCFKQSLRKLFWKNVFGFI